MKVLHYIPNLKAASGSYLLNYCLGLVKNMAGRAEVHVLTSVPCNVNLGEAAIHVCPQGLSLLVWHGRLRRVLSAVRPDVVHIHTCWNFQAARLFRECHKMRIPTVLTPWRGLEPWHFSKCYLFSKLPKSILFQRNMVMRAGALHAVCAQEEADISTFGWYPGRKAKRSLNDRVVMTDIFSSSDDAGAAFTTDVLLQLYRKVADSEPFPKMTADELLVEDGLIMAGAFNGRLDVAVPDDVILRMRQLDANAWRRIMLHSADQGVLGHVMRGINITGVNVPPLEVDKVERFPLHTYVTRDFVERKSGRLVAKVKSACDLQPTEFNLCEVLVRFILKARYGAVRRTDFVEVCLALRFTDYDEAAVETALRKVGLARYAVGLLQIMKERYALGEGFMFAEPHDGKEAKLLKVKLYKSDIQ